ncbi:MAG: hypothetical protein ACSHXD_10290 [Marinosulfonomonas sp.]
MSKHQLFAGYRRLFAILLIVSTAIGTAVAQDKALTLSAPDALVETGLLGHILPRFTLKHRLRVTIVPPGSASDVSISTDDIGQPVFQGPEQIWYFDSAQEPPSPEIEKFRDWLYSDVGKNTIESFQPQDAVMFTTDFAQDTAPQEVAYTGDVLQGEALSLKLCGRCHVVSDVNRMKAIGSTPSFGVLRTFEDWDFRFQAFYTLNPHPSFTQIVDVTEPFADNAPSPIHPLRMTTDDLEAILAYVAQIAPADLGAPIQHQ